MYFPLRVHGHHSMLTGVDSPADLASRAAELGLPGLALADVDTLCGLVDFLIAARRIPKRGHAFHPIVAAEISDPSGEPGRIVALVENAQGYRNLCKLVSARHLGDDPGVRGAQLGEPESFDLVASAVKHQAGLIFLADHPRLLIELHGRVDPRALFAAISPAALRTRSTERAAAFGLPRNAHLSPLRRPPSDRRAREESAEDDLEEPKTPAPQTPVSAFDLRAAARAIGAPTLAVPDVYCAYPNGWADHRIRTAIKHNALACDLPESWIARQPCHLLAPSEMEALYAEAPDETERTLEVAQRCTFAPELGGILFPTIELERGETAGAQLARFAFEGARARYRPLRSEVVMRLEYELGTIERLGFAPYFLLVKRIADFARAQEIPCVGRGSAADSLVAYCLALTDADPLRYRLTFERFLNPARRDRPDIDLDFCWRRRDEVLEHVYGLFGSERTAMIATINRCGPRAAFREAALVEGLPPAEVNRWSRRLPWAAHGVPGSSSARGADENPLELALRRTPEAAGFPFDDPRWRRVLSAAARLLDAPRHYGLHPGGVVVAPGPITDFVPCQRAKKGVIVTQFDKDAVEAIGLVKMDLLGNRALTTVDDCLKTLRARGIEVDIHTVPEDDPATARTLIEGRTLGCFQVESPGMRNLLKQTGACRMDDVIQAIALIRPGPAASGMKDAYVRRFRKREDPRPPHPRLTDLLWETHGVMLYQEDVMQVAARMAGMDLAEADLLRRALQKRRPQDLEKLCLRFVAGCAEEGIARADALHVWDLVANFAGFAFCKAHAVTYGRIAYRAVWLKTHHAAVYLAAFLASETGYYDARVYVEEARRLSVPILPPDVNKSGRTFATEWSPHGVAALRIGLGQVKGLSERTLETILGARTEHGPFLSLPDMLERTRAHTDEAQALIQCGALDGFDRTRPELLWRLHLLRAPERRPPRVRFGDGETPLDPAQLAACRATPATRTNDALKAARARAGGWRANGLGLGNVDLAPGETAALFADPETPALALPRLPDVDRKTRGRLELALLGLTVSAHPTTLFPCPADERIDELGAQRPANPIGCGELDRYQGGRVTLRGWPAATRHVRTQDGRSMRFLTLEDESGIAEAVVFPDVYERDGRHLAQAGTLCVTGVVLNQMGACTLHAERIW